MKDYFRKSLLALVILPPFLEPLPPHGKILNPLFTENPGGWKGVEGSDYEDIPSQTNCYN